MSDCVFCKIVRGEIPCARVFEDEHVLAFDDIHPMAPVHVVIIPKKHIATLMDVDVDNSDVIHRLTAAAQKVARIKKSTKAVSARRLTAMPRADRWFFICTFMCSAAENCRTNWDNEWKVKKWISMRN